MMAGYGTLIPTPGVSRQQVEADLAAITPQQAGEIVTADASGALTRRVNVIDISLYADKSGTSDATADVQRAITAAGAIAGGNAGVVLYAPSNSAFKITDTLTVPDSLKNSFHLHGDGPLGCLFDCTGLGAKPALLTDPNATPATASRRQYWRLRNVFFNGPGAGVSGSVGLHLNNCLLGQADHVVVTGFEKNVWLDALNLANGAACYYNDFYTLVSLSGGTALYVDKQANSNHVFGGRLGLSSMGLYIGDNADNVTLHGTDIEGNTGTDAVVIDGFGCHLLGVRLENPSSTYDITFNGMQGAGANDGASNVVIAYHANGLIDSRVRDLSVNKSNTVIWPGYFSLGSNSNPTGQVISASRNVAADGKPFATLEDDYTGSGSPIGYRYRQRRLGDVLVSEYSPDGTTWYQSLVIRMNHSTGKSEINFGANNAVALDTNLYRNAADQLKTDDKLLAALGIGVGNSAAATTLGTLAKKVEIFDASGNSLGFVPIYSSIT